MSDQDLSYLDSFSTQYDDGFAQGDGSLRINWYNGAPMLRTPGAFFVTKRRMEALGVEALGSPWREVTRVFASGEEEDGWETAKLRISPIGVRTQDCAVKTDGGLEFLTGRYTKENRPPGWSIYVELMCMIEGFSGPVKWSAKRIKTSMAIINGWRAYRKEILDEARRARKNPRIPAWAFWVTVSSAVDAKGKPVYEDTSEGGPKVTPPMWQWPVGTTEQRIAAMYVGASLLHQGRDIRESFDTFFTTNIDGTPTDAASAKSTSTPVSATAPELDSF